MLKYLPLFLFFTGCQFLGLKETDTIEEAEIKVVHAIESKAGVISETPHHEAEPPYISHPGILKK